MRFTSSISALALAAPLLVSAAPLSRRGTDNNTMLVLQFAHTLEKLETGFYQQALQKFQTSDFVSAGFSNAQLPIEQITIIQQDESTHVTALEEFITNFGSSPLSGCNFDFSSVLTSVDVMAQTARVIENVGVGAYLGASVLIEDPSVLSAAASILTVEARHQTVLNILQSGTAIPGAFDIPLLPQEVLAIAGSFISGCDLGVKANEALTITNTETVKIGTSLTFSSSGIKGDTSNFHCQMLTGGAPFSIALPLNQCVVPSGINGPVAIFITSDDQPLNGNPTQRGSNALVAGPVMAFIDSETQVLSEVIKSGSSSSSSSNSYSGSNSNSYSNSNSNSYSGSSSMSSDQSSMSGMSSNMSGMGSNMSGMSSNSSSSDSSTSVSTTTISPSQASQIVASASSSGSSSSASSSSAAPTGSSGASNNASSGSSSGSGAVVVGVSMVPLPTPSS